MCHDVNSILAPHYKPLLQKVTFNMINAGGLWIPQRNRMDILVYGVTIMKVNSNFPWLVNSEMGLVAQSLIFNTSELPRDKILDPMINVLSLEANQLLGVGSRQILNFMENLSIMAKIISNTARMFDHDGHENFEIFNQVDDQIWTTTIVSLLSH